MTRAAKPINDKCQDTREQIQIVCNFTSLFAIFAIIFVPICPFYPIATFHLSALIGSAAHDCYMQITDYPLQERLGDQETTGSGRSNYFPHFHNLSMMLAAGSGCLYYYVYAINYLNSPSA